MLSPIHFKTAKDIIELISCLEKSGAIELTTRDNKPYVSVKDRHHLLKASDGDIYLLQDVKDYVEQTSEEDIKTATITFKTVEDSTVEDSKVNLAKIKADLSILDRLQGSSDTWVYIQQWNFNLYSDNPLPFLTTIEEIHLAKSSYDTNKLDSVVKTTLSALSLQESMLAMVNSLASLFSQPVQIPLALGPADFISTMSKDLLKATLIQEVKIKHHILSELNKKTTQPEIEALEQWIKEIDDSISQTKKLLNKVIGLLKNHQEKISAAKLKYSQMLEKGESIEEKTEQLEVLNKKQKALSELITRQENIINRLKPVAAYTAIIGVPLLVLTLLLVACAFLVPAITFVVVTISYCAMLGFGLSLLTPWGNKMIDGIISIKKSIESKIDSILDGKRTQSHEIQQQVVGLNHDILFLNLYVDNHLSENMHTSLIGALEGDLKEIDDLERQLDLLTKQESEVATDRDRLIVSPLSMFKQNETKGAEQGTSIVYTPPM